ncbi:MAG: hypothetical protein HVK41_03485 [Pelagibacteraceae bacterium]|jgi:hypothetical protein|nr:hypothetical protein [Pelagibacteraceae bacterium]MBO6470066.1 hypothetical protein [Pelagibacteraceae bacterium]MBO6471642.1 hypothetical protein [Pelagibacteraceae bacterium]MBO6478356.1 hypothetical protein [Pelagibacteraceae bacterium]HJO76918.1 ClpXP protease specificity-enhancing factor SspB [Pelagibacteraceae bacterium]
MKINYSKILKKNMINVLKDVLTNIKNNGLQEGHHLYITFKTNDKKVIIPQWLLDEFPSEMTIVIQHEYWNYDIANDHFTITLSFNDIKADLIVPFSSVISFADPYANFGLKLIQDKVLDNKNNNKTKQKLKTKGYTKKDNIIELNKFRN